MYRLAEVCEQISATTKKLQKESVLSDYLQSLPDDDLSLACIFLSGAPFARRDQRTTNTGFAVLRDALTEVDPQAEEKLGELLLKTGDPGTSVALLFEHRKITATLSLSDVRTYFEQLTTAASNQEKRKLTAEVLNRATPLEAKYIVKILLGGMRIGLQESLVESSIAKAFGQPLKKVQHVNMLLGDIGHTAIMARHSQLEEARMTLLHPLKVMLASPEEDVGKILDYMDGNGLAEDKYDGIRAQIHKESNLVKIYSRDLDDITGSFPDVVSSMSSVPGSFLMDGEIVPYKAEKILTFGELQKRLGRKVLTEEMLRSIPCRYFAFDLLFYNDELLLDRPLLDRRQILDGIRDAHQNSFNLSMQKPVGSAEEIEAAFEASRARNNEGLVVKHPNSTYVPGKRGKSWLKLKRALLTLDVVVTAAEYGHGKRAGFLSDYTFSIKGDGKLLTIGKAYSGITDAELNQLSDLFHKISLKNNGFYHVVPPQIVFEVTFDRINRSNRHSSGFALRFPRIKRIRWDKAPEEIDTLETVEKLYNTYFA
jgi:DNA ligase-1